MQETKTSCLEDLKQGHLAKACERVFRNPASSLTGIPYEAKVLGNYLDALVFGFFNDALIANQVLQNAPFINKATQQQLKFQEAILQIHRRFDDQLPEYLTSRDCQQIDQGLLPYLLSERRQVLLDKQALKNVPQLELPGMRESFMRQLVFGQNILRLKRQKASLFRGLNKNHLFFSRPLLPLKYQAPKGYWKHSSFALAEAESTPAILMDNWDWDWKQLLKELPSEGPVLFLFPSANTLMHCAQFPDLLHVLMDRQSVLLCLDHYADFQLKAQPISQQLQGPIEIVHLTTRAPWLNAAAYLSESLNSLLALPAKERHYESTAADHLYRLGRNLLDTWDAERLGPSRFLAHSNMRRNRDWNDPHKGQLQDKRGQGSVLKNTMGHLLDQERPLYPKRSYQSDGNKIRLAHVVPQLVAVGHAPTKLIRTLTKEHSKDTFDIAIFSTERLVFRPEEYPYDIFCSESSASRAHEVITELKDLGAEVYVDDAKLNFRDSAERLAEQLARWEADIVVFHGPDVINCCASRMCNNPYRVLFEHGSLPEHSGFDLVISSSEESVDLFSKEFAKMGSDLKALPFCYDASSQWASVPPSKSALGLAENTKVLTTISNNLESRVHGDMCWAIGEILRRCPNSYYAPIGHIEDRKGFKERFAAYGVEDRIHILGSQPNPSHLARSMDIYVNEFPFGSGLSILDAMAASCPVVSMHDPSGPPQARYGAVFMGIDYVVTSLRKEDYVNLCCKLLCDDEMYSEWSQHSRERYLEQADAGSYVKKLEALLLKGLHVEGAEANA